MPRLVFQFTPLGIIWPRTVLCSGLGLIWVNLTVNTADLRSHRKGYSLVYFTEIELKFDDISHSQHILTTKLVTFDNIA